VIEEGTAVYKKALQGNPNDLSSHLGLAAAYSILGREEEARYSAAEVLRINPKFSLEHFERILPYKNQADKERAIAAWRKAGLK